MFVGKNWSSKMIEITKNETKQAKLKHQHSHDKLVTKSYYILIIKQFGKQIIS